MRRFSSISSCLRSSFTFCFREVTQARIGGGNLSAPCQQLLSKRGGASPSKRPKLGEECAIVDTRPARSSTRTCSTSWGSLVRAQYRPYHESPAPAGFLQSGKACTEQAGQFAWQRNGNADGLESGRTLLRRCRRPDREVVQFYPEPARWAFRSCSRATARRCRPSCAFPKNAAFALETQVWTVCSATVDLGLAGRTPRTRQDFPLASRSVVYLSSGPARTGESVGVPPQAELRGRGLVLIGIIAFALATGFVSAASRANPASGPPTPNPNPAPKALLAT
jgi:hypothetical protein